MRFASAGVPKGYFDGKVAPQNHPFSIGFIRLFDMAKTHVGFSENVMLFGSFLVHFPKTAPKLFINDRFYKVFYNAFWHFKKADFPFVL